METTTIHTADGTAIATRVYEPAAAAPGQGSVVIGGAMGVRQDFHVPFARWLPTQGQAVLWPRVDQWLAGFAVTPA